MVSSEETADQNVSSDILEKRVSPHSDITESQEIHVTKIPSSKPRDETSIPSVVAQNEVKDSDTTVCALKSDQDGSTHSLVQLEKHLQSGHECTSLIREKVSKDGYNWRKYGQKNVKGNEFIRSYYKCTHPNCQAKKQLEQSNDGQITDSITIGQHNHPRPQLNITKPVDPVLPVIEEKPDKSSSANVEDKAPVEHGCVQIKPSDSIQISNVSPTDEVKAAHLSLTRANNEIHSKEDPDSKRLKKDNSNVDVTGVDKSISESRVVIKTSSEVDFVNDGYRWRKYGQKLVKGNINPRSYYRCSSPGCPVKKHVERASHDPKIVITTYEGQHDHGTPPGRTVTHNPATNANTMTNNGKPVTKSGGNAVFTDTRERSCLDSESRSNEQPNRDSVPKSEAGNKVEFHATSLHSEGPESKLNAQEKRNETSGVKEDSASNNNTCQSRSGVPCRSNEEIKDKVEPKSEGSEDCLNVVAIHDTPGPESELKKQSTSDAEAVKS